MAWRSRRRAEAVQQEIERRVDETLLGHGQTGNVIGVLLPHGLLQQPRDEEPRGDVAVGIRTKLTTLLTLADEGRNDPRRGGRPTGKPAAVCLRRFVRDALHQKTDHREPLLRHGSEPASHKQAESSRYGCGLVPQQLIDTSERFLAPMLDGAEQQLFLVREVVVDGALRDAGRLAHVLEPRVPVAAFGEYGERGIENLVRARVWTTFPAKRSDRHGRTGGGRMKRAYCYLLQSMILDWHHRYVRTGGVL